MSFVFEWLKRFEDVLVEEAKLAGLLDHPSMVGAGREFLVKRVLKSILPPSIHIGTGIVVSFDQHNKEAKSKQIDVIIYDSRFPFLETQPGIGKYFLEGVIATIEVKSTLNIKTLKDALDNCASVTELNGHVADYNAMDRLAREWMTRGLSKLDAEEKVKSQLTPRTYIFSFTNAIQIKTACKVINDWYDKRGESRSAMRSHLPYVIATKSFNGLQNDVGTQDIDPGPTVTPEALKDFGPNARVVMGVWPMKNRFAFLSSHLLHTVSKRLGLVHAETGIVNSIDAYLPWKDFESSFFSNTVGGFIFWSGKKLDKSEHN